MSDRLAKVRDSGAPERRMVPVADFEIRADGDSLSLEGYATVFDSPYEMYGGPDKGGWTELVDRKAFDVTLRAKPDLHLLVNHGGLPLARTKSGTMRLSTDKTGLNVEVPDLDRRDPDVQRLEVKMERGDLDEMSFAFRTVREEFNDDTGERRLTELNLHRGDVSVVNFGANPATTAALRDLDESDLEDMGLDDIARLQALLSQIRAAKNGTTATLTLSEIRKTYPNL